MPAQKCCVHLRFSVLLLMLVAIATSMPAALNINMDALQKSVVFLYSADLTGRPDDPQKSLGTAFLLRVALASSPKSSYSLLVTARHIVDPQWAKCVGSNPALIYARLNKLVHTTAASEQGTTFVPLPLVKNGHRVWKHPSDDMADAAVMLVESPNTTLRDVDGGTIPVSDFPTDDEMKGIGVGDQIVSAGLVPGFPGSNRNRAFSNSATSQALLMRISKLVASQTAPYNIRGWFLAANLVPGNSSSPVFFVPPGGPGITFGSPDVGRPVLLGIQSSSLVSADLAVMTQSTYLCEAIQLLHLPDANLTRGPSTSPQTK